MPFQYKYDHYKMVPKVSDKVGAKKRKPKIIAFVDEDNCTGCQVCVPFCPVDCISPVNLEKYDNQPIPPVQIRFDECIGCQICVRVCDKLTWNAITMRPTAELVEELGITLNASFPVKES
jgi:Pyruvate/2-oxoacid:ferredoxin oxidoreductase delta subunit